MSVQKLVQERSSALRVAGSRSAPSLWAEADAWREIAGHILAQTWGWLPCPFTTSSAMRERGLLSPYLFGLIRTRAEEWSAPSVGTRTDEQEWALVCLLIACECDDEAGVIATRQAAAGVIAVEFDVTLSIDDTNPKRTTRASRSSKPSPRSSKKRVRP